MSTPSSGRPSRSTSLSRSQPPASAPPPVPSAYPPTHTSAYPPTASELRATEEDPLAIDNSPNLHASSSSQLPPGAAYDFGDAYTAVNLGGGGGGDDEQSRYYASMMQSPPDALHARDQSLDLVDAYQGGGRTSLSTHNSRTQLRTSPSRGGGILPTGGSEGDLEKHYDSRPIHPGASVQLASHSQGQGQGQSQQSSRAEKMYGSGGEKGSPTASGYNSPKNGYGHGRSGSRAGLGQWSSPGGGNSPYGRLGGSEDDGTGGMNSAASSNPNLQFAEGDFITPSKNWFSKAFFAVYNSSFIVRWIIYIVPILAILWIPAIIGFTAAPNGAIWSVPLLWWSIWLTVVWCGWWGAALVAKLGPKVLHNTLGVIAPELRHYITYIKATEFYVGAAGWALANWISFLPLINSHTTSGKSSNTLRLITQGLFGIFIVLVLLLGEKLIIQIIAHNFHKKSYEDRIVEQKFQINSLVALYLNSRDIGRSDTLDGAMRRPKNKRLNSDPTLLVKKAVKGAKKVAQTATTVIGTVASEIAGERVLQPNSPSSMVVTALGSTNKTKHLARRIYYSFCPSYRTGLVLSDISRCFRNREETERAFAIFDRDLNGDATLEEIEMACLDIHRERLALQRSMRDIDSAVARLDGIFVTLWWVISALIIAGLLDASFNSLVASAGTFVLGLSWLIGTTAQEIIASSIFLFIKHAYDVGDKVEIDGLQYIVLEMHLLSTIFKKIDGTVCQAPHSLLNTKFVQNYRRSGPIWESFTFDVDFSTSFAKIEALRIRMLEFLESEKRDFIPSIDISIKDFEGQGKLSLSALINYKTSWQNGALKSQRRNKWICALKVAMSELQIYGPGEAGNPSPAPAPPTEYTLIPYEDLKAAKLAAEGDKDPSTSSFSSDPNTAVNSHSQGGPEAATSTGGGNGGNGAMNASNLTSGLMGHDRIEREESGEGNGRLRNRF
ncbi:uncharacterized protein JCM6883_005503 [Sporobolomyces salmoneus]|uniref:uncharacterized protein n=1 Tax=Sporobolomyces salmoneus TaxID=183962 RepID=UPI00317955AA